MFNEIVDNCPILEAVHFMIAPSITLHTVVEGYEIHMSGKKMDDKTVAYLRDLTSRNGLFFESKNDSVGIFELNRGVVT